MEKKQQIKFYSKHLSLTNYDGLNNYCSFIGKFHNNLHKYSVLNANIEIDAIGDPYCLLKWIDNIEEKEITNPKHGVDIYGMIIGKEELEKFYDPIVNDSIDYKVKIIFDQDYNRRDMIEKCSIYHKLFIYVSKRDGSYYNDNDKGPSVKSGDKK